MNKKILAFLFHTNHASLESFATLLLRIGVSMSMMYLHGLPKLYSYIDGNFEFYDLFSIGSEYSLLLAIFAEVFCSILLILGLFTRLSVIPLITTMVVAIFLVNAGQPLIVKEKGLIFLMTYLFILLVGPGKYSIDRLLAKSLKSFKKQ